MKLIAKPAKIISSLRPLVISQPKEFTDSHAPTDTIGTGGLQSIADSSGVPVTSTVRRRAVRGARAERLVWRFRASQNYTRVPQHATLFCPPLGLSLDSNVNRLFFKPSPKSRIDEFSRSWRISLTVLFSPFPRGRAAHRLASEPPLLLASGAQNLANLMGFHRGRRIWEGMIDRRFSTCRRRHPWWLGFANQKCCG